MKKVQSCFEWEIAQIKTNLKLKCSIFFIYFKSYFCVITHGIINTLSLPGGNKGLWKSTLVFSAKALSFLQFSANILLVPRSEFL